MVVGRPKKRLERVDCLRGAPAFAQLGDDPVVAELVDLVDGDEHAVVLVEAKPKPSNIPISSRRSLTRIRPRPTQRVHGCQRCGQQLGLGRDRPAHR